MPTLPRLLTLGIAAMCCTALPAVGSASLQPAAQEFPTAMTSTSGETSFTLEDITYRYLDNAQSALAVKSAQALKGEATLPSEVTHDGRSLPVTTIDAAAFADNTALTSLTLPNGITQLSADLFKGCTALHTITVADDHPAYTTPNGVLYNKEKTRLVFCPAARLGALSIAEGTTSIAPRALMDCSRLTALTLPASLTEAGDDAFTGTRLESLTVYAPTIGNWFKGSTSLKTLVIDNEDFTAPADAFDQCTSLTDVSLSFNDIFQPQWEDVNLFKGCSAIRRLYLDLCDVPVWFKGLKSLESVTVSDNIWSITESAFEGCTSLTNLELTDGLIEIGKYAFKDCSSLVSVRIPNNIVIREQAFENCTALKNITFPEELISVRYNSFKGTAWEKNLPDGPVYVADQLFVYKGEMQPNTVFELREGIRRITDYAFAGQTNLAGIRFPDSEYIYIGANVFDGCTGLKDIDWENIDHIGEEAFARCNSLTEANITSNTETILSSAFAQCSSLRNVRIELTEFSMFGFKLFDGCEQLDTLYINGMSDVNAMYFSGNFRHLVVGENTSRLDICDFNCPRLESVDLPSSLTSIANLTFTASPAIRHITLRTATPPAIDAETWGSYEATLYVPQGSREAYASTLFWKNFNITEGTYTGIDSPTNATGTHRETRWYDLKGNAVDRPSKGIYIQRQGKQSRKVKF